MKSIFSAFIFSLYLTSCSGGSSPSAVGDPAAGFNNNGCSQEYFTTMIGTYSGTVEYTAGEYSCLWDLTMNINGKSFGQQCDLTVETVGEVEQLTFTGDDGREPYQCLRDQGTRRAREPASDLVDTINPMVLDNSYYPVFLAITRDEALPRGPYFGDDSRTADYLHLFDSITEHLIDFILIEGDGTISLSTSNGRNLGTLLKGENL